MALQNGMPKKIQMLTAPRCSPYGAETAVKPDSITMNGNNGSSENPRNFRFTTGISVENIFPLPGLKQLLAQEIPGSLIIYVKCPVGLLHKHCLITIYVSIFPELAEKMQLMPGRQ